MSEAAANISNIDVIKSKMKTTWSAGDFGRIAKMIEVGAEEFIARIGITPGEHLLDIACGTGNLAIPAAKAGAVVTGVDIARNLVEQARDRAVEEGLTCRFDEGDAEAMPYADASFDTVVTMFGAMFAPRPDVTAGEMLRVCRPGGRIAMANWTPTGFTGKMFKIGATHVPPPPGIPSPALWGDKETVAGRLENGFTDLQLTVRPALFKFAGSPADVVELFREYFGPTKLAFAALDQDGQDAFRKDLIDLWTENNRATDGSTEVESEYLEVRAIRD